MGDPADALTESTRMRILQGRFEALHLGAAQVEPLHLVLGVLKTLESSELTALAAAPGRIDALCATLGAAAAPAPLSTADINYAGTCHALVTAAISAAGPAAVPNVDPLHLLLGAHEADTALSAQLVEHDLAPDRIAAALARLRADSR
jgi:hypothetical protein